MNNYNLKCKVIEEELKSVWPEWHVAGHLGRGAFGDVYHIYKENYGIRVDSALKVIQVINGMPTVALPLNDPDATVGDTVDQSDIPNTLRKEIQIMEALRGAPNIVNIEDFYFKQEGATSYLFVRMELLTSLNEVQSGKDGRYILSSVSEIRKLGRDICTALMYCEKKGIIHRDIKPANLFVDEFGNYKVGDFGASKRMDTVHAALTMTSIGTISYMAPEIFRGRAYNNTVDIYALGLILYQLFNNGRLPFLPTEGHYTAQDIDRANYMRLHGTPLPGLEGKVVGGERIDSYLDTVVRKACAMNPGERYQTAKEFYDALIITETEVKSGANSGEKQQSILPNESFSESRQKESRGPVGKVVSNDTYLPSTPEDEFCFSVKNNECSIELRLDKTYKEIKIPGKYQGRPVTSIGNGAFKKCKSLTSVTIPDGVATIGVCAFLECENLTNVTIPDSLAIIGPYAFSKCESLTGITIPDCVTSIGPYAFSKCESLTSITIPDSVTSIGTRAFMGCRSLKSVTIPDSAFIGEGAFWGCESLADQNGFVIIRGVLHSYCYSGKHVTIPSSVKTIGDEAFMGCESLTSITIPDSVTSIGARAFMGCESLTSVTIPDSVTSIGEGAFRRCKSLADQNGFVIIRGVLHSYCYSGKYVTIPSSVKTIGDEAFSRCESLTSITIPDSVATIGFGAFSECKSLSNVTISDSVASIGPYAFNGCESLRTIFFPGDYETLKAVFARNNADDEIVFACIEQGAKEVQQLKEVKQKSSLEFRRKQGLCSFCGGTFKKGLFTTTCINCGRKKDY